MENIAYCRNCRSYENDMSRDDKDLGHCPKCDGVDLIALTPYKDGTFIVEDFTYQSYFGFQDIRDFQFKMKILGDLVGRSQKTKKTRSRTDYIN